MNILIFISSLSSGGAERVAANLANHWAGKGWTITMVTLAPLQIDFYELNPAIQRITLNQIHRSSHALCATWNNLRRIRVLRQVLRQVRPDIALSLMSTANVLLALAAWNLPIYTIGSEHTYPPNFPLTMVWEKLRRYLYRRLAAVIALTDESAVWLRTCTYAKQISVIHNAVHWPLPGHMPYLDPAMFGIKGHQRLLAVGRLDWEKGFDCLITAFSTLAARYPDWDLLIVGEGPLRPVLQAQIDATNLQQRVFMPGRAGNIGQWYASADLYVMSSRFEGFPNTLTEALTYGLPVVSFDCKTGPRDIIRHEVDGLLVPAGHITALTEALDRFMGDTDLRQRFSERAIEARERFSMDSVSQKWELLFNKLCH